MSESRTLYPRRLPIHSCSLTSTHRYIPFANNAKPFQLLSTHPVHATPNPTPPTPLTRHHHTELHPLLTLPRELYPHPCRSISCTIYRFSSLRPTWDRSMGPYLSAPRITRISVSTYARFAQDLAHLSQLGKVWIVIPSFFA